MTTETPTDTVDVTDRLDAIIEQLDRIEKQLEENTERTEISAKFVAEIHTTWELNDGSAKVTKPKTDLKVGDRVSIGTNVGTIQWFAINPYGYTTATIDWKDEETPSSSLVIALSRVATPGI
jgi:hypothetical protein